MKGLTIICATRETEDGFYKNCLLGKTIESAYREFGLHLHMFFENTRGLSECYNIGISKADEDDILVFVHDDIAISDFFWIKNVIIGLERFHLIGVAGNRRRVKNQPAWTFINFDQENKKWKKERGENLSGMVGHGSSFPCNLSIYGRPEQECVLLDGVFLAAKKKTFIERNIRFDERFKFHFYDMDICRQFERNGLSMGTVPISIIHDSGGNFGSPEWIAAYEAYLDKWERYEALSSH